MNFLTSFLFVVLVGAAVAYDFKDSFYNQILKGDLEDNYDTVGGFSNHRVTRETNEKEDDKKCKSHKDRWHKGSCCSDDDAKVHSEQIKELKKQCFAEIRATGNQANQGEEQTPMDVFSCERMNKTKTEITCVLECVAKKQNVVDNSGDLKDAEVAKFVKEELLNAEWQRAIVDKTIEKCSQEAREEARKPRAATACNPSAIKFSHCIWREIQLACPADKIQDAQKCQRFREKMAKKDMTNDAPEQPAMV